MLDGISEKLLRLSRSVKPTRTTVMNPAAMKLLADMPSVTADRSCHRFTVGTAQQPRFVHFPGLLFCRPERLPEFIECGGIAERRSHVQLAVSELTRELPNVRLAHSEFPRKAAARPSPV
jgi:hypothetical protein